MQLLGVIASLALQATAPQTPPIFQPGAPGQPSRAIDARAAVALSRTTFIPADVQFMQHMIVHHSQAVEMVELSKTRAASPAVKRMGERIAMSQEAELTLMRDWLSARGQPLEMAHSHAGHGGHHGHQAADDDTPIMPGMLSPAQMRTLAAARGPEFDRLFLTGMIQHHQGALDMVKALLDQPGAAEDPMLSDFAASVVADQSAEILRMQSILSEL